MSLRTSEDRLRRLIDAMAAYHQLPGLTYEGATYTPGELLEGLILTESSGDPHARRYEPHQDRAGRTDAPTDADMPGRDDGESEDDASYGLTQVMGYNWRRILGLRPGTPVRFGYFAYDPVFSIRAGLIVLQSELQAVYRQHPHAGDDERMVRALCRYNGGPTGDVFDPDTKDLRLRGYVKKVVSRAATAKADRQQKGWKS